MRVAHPVLQRSAAWLLMALCAACTGIDPALRGPSRPAVAVTARPTSYDRREWRHWIDADHDCQDTRQEVLIEESEVPVEFADARHCRVKRGRWTCPYTGLVVTDPAQLDVDHLVPLENADRSGGWRWSPSRKKAYANDLTEPEHLIAVAASANRAKGSKGPEMWLPENAAFVCEYVRDWQAVKVRWALTMTEAERRRVDEVLAGCAR